MKYYTGVGSRETPSDVMKLMTDYAERLYWVGYTLRSGGADSADMCFESGHDSGRYILQTQLPYLFPRFRDFKAECRKEIYLPWRNFNKRGDEEGIYYSFKDDIQKQARELVSRIHPAPGALSVGSWKLHMRNCNQVLGQDLKTPSDFLICWTKNGQEVGGTRTAIVLAKQNNIPVYNLFFEEHRKELENLISKLEDNETKEFEAIGEIIRRNTKRNVSEIGSDKG